MWDPGEMKEVLWGGWGGGSVSLYIDSSLNKVIVSVAFQNHWKTFVITLEVIEIISIRKSDKK